MLNLAEYKRNPTCLSDYLPWACLVAPGIVLNKDGSYQRSFRYRGPDLDSATEAELVSVSARLNNVLKRFGDGWALFFEAVRVPANRYPGARFADAASWLVDEERRNAFIADRAHHESRYYLTLLYLPPPERTRRAEQLFYERAGDDRFDAQTFAHLSWFETETGRALEMLSALLPEVEALDDEGTLAYLHGTISRKHHPVAVPTIPVHLDAVLCDTPLVGGIEPKLGDAHLRMLTVIGFPNATSPGLLDALNDLGFSYRWTTRWIALDKTEANKHLGKLRRHWFSKRKSVGAILREVMWNRETALLDPDADAKALDADEAMQELGSDAVAFGYITTTIVVTGADTARADDKLLAVERIVNGRGFTTIRETLNAVEAWLGSIPGNPYANIRQPIVHTLNLVHLMPVSAVWAGPERNQHLDAPPLMLTETRGSTPFRLDLHIGDVGHTLIVGPTGAGKSVLLALLALQFRRFIGARVAIFDRGKSARAAVLAMNGMAVELGLEGTMSLQPLARINEPGELAFALDWVMGLLANEGLKSTPEIKDAVWTALQNLASAPKAERTLTGLADEGGGLVYDTIRAKLLREFHMGDDRRPFPILPRRSTVWPAELKPMGNDGCEDRLELKAYLELNRHHFPYLHDEVIEQWVYRHWLNSPYVHVALSEMRSEKTTWNSADFLEQVGIGEALGDEIGESEIIKNHWDRLLQCPPFKGMWETGTWDFPPLVLYNEAGFRGLSDELPRQKYWLIEGHQRYRGLNYLHYKGRLQHQHEVYVMQWPGGLTF